MRKVRHWQCADVTVPKKRDRESIPTRTCTYQSVSEGQVKTKQQGMSCGMTAAQKPCAPPNKAGLPAASASSLITFQLHQHRFTTGTSTLREISTASIDSFKSVCTARGDARRRVIQSHRRDLKLWMAACSTESERCCVQGHLGGSCLQSLDTCWWFWWLFIKHATRLYLNIEDNRRYASWYFDSLNKNKLQLEQTVKTETYKILFTQRAAPTEQYDWPKFSAKC